MDNHSFVDYYEILELSPNANSGTIERMFRYFAQRYHPDNPNTGDRAAFDVVIEAHKTLGNPVKRAQYDIQYKNNIGKYTKLVESASDGDGVGRDAHIQRRILSLLYARRRQNAREPELADLELERLLDCPSELVDFQVWYLKEKGWIVRMEDGFLAITAKGVDHAHTEHHDRTARIKLIEQSRSAAQAH